MKPVLEKIHRSPTNSIRFKEDIIPYISIPWHYHPEYEITLFTEGSGRRYVGDHVETFNGLELIMLGKNLPHCWRSDEIYFKANKQLQNRALVIHFKEEAFGEYFFDKPEMKLIKTLMNESGRGLKFTGKSLSEGRALMEKICKAQGFERLLLLFNLLHKLSKSTEREYLASVGYRSNMTKHKIEQIEKVYAYVLKHFLDEIDINFIANEVNMSISAFCRFFKRHTGKNFSQLVNEMRIGHACRLLIDTDYPVRRICFESGFNNLSYFFRTFQKITTQSPSMYRKEYLVNGINQ